MFLRLRGVVAVGAVGAGVGCARGSSRSGWGVHGWAVVVDCGVDIWVSHWSIVLIGPCIRARTHGAIRVGGLIRVCHVVEVGHGRRVLVVDVGLVLWIEVWWRCVGVIDIVGEVWIHVVDVRIGEVRGAWESRVCVSVLLLWWGHIEVREYRWWWPRRCLHGGTLERRHHWRWHRAGIHGPFHGWTTTLNKFKSACGDAKKDGILCAKLNDPPSPPSKSSLCSRASALLLQDYPSTIMQSVSLH